MRYQGGKTWIAKPIVQAISGLVSDEPIWEPFCGGFSVTVELAKTRDRSAVWATDIHPAVISLAQAIQQGWEPPSTVTAEDWEAAKLLPDTDPLKGFIGFGTSFGGQWFYGLAKSSNDYNYAKGSRDSLRKQFWDRGQVIPSLQGVKFECRDFFDVEPGSWRGHLYCDPPYQSTKQYTTGAFDHDRFWARCQDWADAGSRVFVSEFQCPVPSVLRWSVERNWSITRLREAKKRVDCLFEVLPRGLAAEQDIWDVMCESDV